MLFGGHKGMSFFNEVFNNFNSNYYSVGTVQNKVIVFSILIELITIAISLSIMIVLKSTHTKKTERYLCIKGVTRTIIIAAALNLLYYIFIGTVDFTVASVGKNLTLIYLACKFGIGILASTFNIYASYSILKYILSVLGIEKTDEASRVKLIGYFCVIGASLLSFAVAGHSIVEIASDLSSTVFSDEPTNCISAYNLM